MDAFWGILPFLVILIACPLMMIFMMRGHGGHSGHEEHTTAQPPDTAVTDAKLHTLEREVETLRRQAGMAPPAQLNGATDHKAHTPR